MIPNHNNMLFGRQTDFSKAETYFLQRRRDVIDTPIKKTEEKKTRPAWKESKMDGGRQKD